MQTSIFSDDFYLQLHQIERSLSEIPIEEISYLAESRQRTRQQRFQSALHQATEQLPVTEKLRARSEFESWGPLQLLIDDEDVTEILVNGWDNIWFEKHGHLFRHPDQFASSQSYKHCLERICDQARVLLTSERPMAQGSLHGFRLQMVGAELTQNQTGLSLRRHPKNPWNFDRLKEKNWAKPEAYEILNDWLTERLNFLVVGPTGTGKTSITNACLQMLPENERALLLEDTQELNVPNAVSQRLLTRQDPQAILPEINMAELLRQSLRLRPDRLVLGEMRGPEAKDFLMALSTGHAGSFGTMHASSPHQALIRLEMLVQLGAPHWGLSAIRRLIFLSLQGIVLVGRNKAGERVLSGLYRITSLEENGFLVERTY